MEHSLFFAGLSFFFVHEMDAIRCKEWRIFPGLSLLSNKLGQFVFIVAHIPLFILIYYQLTSISENKVFILGFDIFMVVHVVLHLLFLKHKSNEFKGWLSWGLIIGTGLFGLADLLI